MKTCLFFLNWRKVIAIFIIIFLCGLLIAETGKYRFRDTGMDNRSVPNLIDYQGKITDSSNNPITTSVSITFTIYDASTGGTAEWTETHASVTPVDGLVHVLLGSETAFEDDLFDGSDLWLGINVNSDGEMIPRLRIVSVPYAIYANDADKLDGYDSSYFMTAATEFGIDDLTDGKTGGFSVFLGSGAGELDDGSGNTSCGVGYNALGTNISGSMNTAFGASALYHDASGTYNVGIGSGANFYNYDGINNTIIGTMAGFGTQLHSKSGNVFLGYSAGYFETGDNKLYIDNSNSTSPLIYGEFDNNKIIINGEFQATGNVGIGNSNPACDLHIGDGTGTDSKMIQIDANGIKGRLLSYAPDDIFCIQAGTEWVAGSSAEMRFTGTFGDPVHMTIKPDSKVGIGTTNPAHKFDVRSSAATQVVADDDVFISNMFGYHDNGLLVHTGYNDGIDIARFSSIGPGYVEVPRMVIKDSGFIGIGTTNPAQKLSVNGVIESTTGGVKFPDGTIQATAAGGGIEPVAYGYITTDATVSSAYPAGVTCTWNVALSRYEITIPGENYFIGDYATAVTPVSGSSRSATTDSISGKLVVFIHDNTDTKIQSLFHFVVFKM
jgi:hypothetical protein